jgi:hypothetical protein
MANPNIVNVTDIRANTVVANVTTSMTALVTNSAASGKAIKVNALYLTCISGANGAIANVDILRSSGSFRLVEVIEVPYKSTLDVVSKAFYLLEGDTLRVQANANSFLQAICSFEEIA